MALGPSFIDTSNAGSMLRKYSNTYTLLPKYVIRTDVVSADDDNVVDYNYNKSTFADILETPELI